VNELENARAKMDAAIGLKEVLAAAHDGFLAMVPVIEDFQDPASPHFATFVIAGATAATGRLAILAAPSLPDASRSAGFADSISCGCSAEEAAALLASLCQLMARRLYDAALTAADADDREACSRASHYARELCAWFGGDPAP
jgi:hypothetical protein